MPYVHSLPLFTSGG